MIHYTSLSHIYGKDDYNIYIRGTINKAYLSDRNLFGTIGELLNQVDILAIFISVVLTKILELFISTSKFVNKLNSH